MENLHWNECTNFSLFCSNEISNFHNRPLQETASGATWSLKSSDRRAHNSDEDSPQIHYIPENPHVDKIVQNQKFHDQYPLCPMSRTDIFYLIGGPCVRDYPSMPRRCSPAVVSRRLDGNSSWYCVTYTASAVLDTKLFQQVDSGRTHCKDLVQ